MTVIEQLITTTDTAFTQAPPSNANQPFEALTSEHRIINWLLRVTSRSNVTNLDNAIEAGKKASLERNDYPIQDDWQTVSSLCGYQREDFTGLPLTAAEIDFFRRNHRDTDSYVSRDFLSAKTDLPSPLCELYGLYRHRARLDAEAALFVAQSTGSIRVANIMADLLAIGGFANGLEFIQHLTMSYSVPTAFDTSDIIDRANHEALRRLAFPVDHPAHLLKLTPDEISVLAANIVERNALASPAFLEKANRLAEARQDVNRLPSRQHFVTAVAQNDLPTDQAWVARICTAYAHIFGDWVAREPAIEAIVKAGSNLTQKV